MSQCDQLAALLADGEWWTTRELLREVPCIVHSRVAELRKRGLEITHETTGPGAAGSRYRLTHISAGPDSADAAAGDAQRAARANGAPTALVGEKSTSALTTSSATVP